VAQPQIENGHTKIANEILEHLMSVHLSPNQWQVLLCIIRKTYGFHKKVDYIANYQITVATNLGKTVVSRALHNLESRNMITRKGKYIGFQKDWESWAELAELPTLDVKLAEQSTPEKLAIRSPKLAILPTELAGLLTKVSSPVVAQKKKDTLTKDTLTKERYGEFDNVLLADVEYQKLQDRFGDRVKALIETLSQGIESKGYKYKSHYAAILTWERREQGGSHGKDREKGIPGNRPAGAFDDIESD